MNFSTYTDRYDPADDYRLRGKRRKPKQLAKTTICINPITRGAKSPTEKPKSWTCLDTTIRVTALPVPVHNLEARRRQPCKCWLLSILVENVELHATYGQLQVMYTTYFDRYS